METAKHFDTLAKEPTLPVPHGDSWYREEHKPITRRAATRWFPDEAVDSFTAAERPNVMPQPWHTKPLAFSVHTYLGGPLVDSDIFSPLKDFSPIIASLPAARPPLAERVIAASKDLIRLDLRTAPLEHQVFQVNLNYALGPYVVVDGEWCTWRADKVLGVVVKREPWSLLGTGDTLDDALADFRREAAELANLMQHDRLDELTDEARRMHDFVLRYLPVDG